MVNCSIDEDIYGYATSRVRNIEDMMTGFKHPIKYTGLPANCFKRMEVGPTVGWQGKSSNIGEGRKFLCKTSLT